MAVRSQRLAGPATVTQGPPSTTLLTCPDDHVVLVKFVGVNVPPGCRLALAVIASGASLGGEFFAYDRPGAPTPSTPTPDADLRFVWAALEPGDRLIASSSLGNSVVVVFGAFLAGEVEALF